jgi:hypothetical protein
MADKSIHYLRKLTTSGCGLSAENSEKVAVENPGVETVGLRIYGRITDVKKETGTFGPYVRFNGEFEAVNQITQDKYRSTQLIVPPVAEQLLSDLASDLSAGSSVQFALDLLILENKSQKGGWKFRYGVKSLLAPKAKDALTQLGESLESPQIADQTGKKKK